MAEPTSSSRRCSLKRLSHERPPITPRVDRRGRGQTTRSSRSGPRSGDLPATHAAWAARVVGALGYRRRWPRRATRAAVRIVRTAVVRLGPTSTDLAVVGRRHVGVQLDGSLSVLDCSPNPYCTRNLAVGTRTQRPTRSPESLPADRGVCPAHAMSRIPGHSLGLDRRLGSDLVAGGSPRSSGHRCAVGPADPRTQGVGGHEAPASRVPDGNGGPVDVQLVGEPLLRSPRRTPDRSRHGGRWKSARFLISSIRAPMRTSCFCIEHGRATGAVSWRTESERDVHISFRFWR